MIFCVDAIATAINKMIRKIAVKGELVVEQVRRCHTLCICNLVLCVLEEGGSIHGFLQFQS